MLEIKHQIFYALAKKCGQVNLEEDEGGWLLQLVSCLAMLLEQATDHCVADA